MRRARSHRHLSALSSLALFVDISNQPVERRKVQELHRRNDYGVSKSEHGIFLHQQSTTLTWPAARWRTYRLCDAGESERRDGCDNGQDHESGARPDPTERCMFMGDKETAFYHWVVQCC